MKVTNDNRYVVYFLRKKMYVNLKNIRAFASSPGYHDKPRKTDSSPLSEDYFDKRSNAKIHYSITAEFGVFVAPESNL